MVVQLGDDDLIPRAHSPTQGPGELIGEGGHVLTEDHLLRLAAQKVGHGLPGLVPDPVGLGAGGEGPVGVGVPVKEVVRHGYGNRAGDLGPAGSVEVGDVVASVEALEGRGSGNEYRSMVARAMMSSR